MFQPRVGPGTERRTIDDHNIHSASIDRNFYKMRCIWKSRQTWPMKKPLPTTCAENLWWDQCGDLCPGPVLRTYDGDQCREPLPRTCAENLCPGPVLRTSDGTNAETSAQDLCWELLPRTCAENLWWDQCRDLCPGPVLRTSAQDLCWELLSRTCVENLWPGPVLRTSAQDLWRQLLQESKAQAYANGVWSEYFNQLAARQMSTCSDSCRGCLVTNNGHPSSWKHPYVRVSRVRPNRASRMQAMNITDKPWCAADNHHTAGIPVSAASGLFSTHAGVLC